MFPLVWLTPVIPTMEIPYFPPSKDESTWIVINPEMASYIRVLYDEHNLKLNFDRPPVNAELQCNSAGDDLNSVN